MAEALGRPLQKWLTRASAEFPSTWRRQADKLLRLDPPQAEACRHAADSEMRRLTIAVSRYRQVLSALNGVSSNNSELQDEARQWKRALMILHALDVLSTVISRHLSGLRVQLASSNQKEVQEAARAIVSLLHLKAGVATIASVAAPTPQQSVDEAMKTLLELTAARLYQSLPRGQIAREAEIVLRAIDAFIKSAQASGSGDPEALNRATDSLLGMVLDQVSPLGGLFKRTIDRSKTLIEIHKQMLDLQKEERFFLFHKQFFKARLAQMEFGLDSLAWYRDRCSRAAGDGS